MAQLLRRAGPILVQYLLRAYDGRLTLLAADLRQFLDQCRTGHAPDAETLEAFIRATFGPAHHMTSLFRCALCATTPRKDRRIDRVQGQDFDVDVEYELNPNVEILCDVHDCQLVIERIQELESRVHLLDDALAGDRALCLINFSNGSPTLYRVDSAAEPLIRLFEQPRSCRAVKALLADALRVSHFDSRFLEELARAGIIVPSRESSTQRNPRLGATV